MLWLIYALIAAFFTGANSLFHRAIMLKEDTMSYACIFQYLAALFFIPFLVMEFAIPFKVFPWVLVVIASALWAIETFAAFEAFTHVPVSIRTPIDQVKLVFILILSVLFLSEALFIEKIIGTLLIFAGVFMLTYEKKRWFAGFAGKGVKLVFLSAFVFSLVTIVDKAALAYFPAGTYGFIVFLLPAVMLTPFLRKKKNEVRQLFRQSWLLMVGAVVLSILAYYFRLKAFSVAESSLAFPITRLGILVSVLGGILFLNERDFIARKMIAAVIAIIGASLIAGAFSF
jgi:drug/metabolite transporter (DMT)-like permease